MRILCRGAGAALALLLCAGVFSGARADVASAQPAPDPHQILLPSLQGLRFVSAQTAVVKKGFTRHGVTVDGPYLLYRPGIYQQLESFVGKPLHAGDLSRITAVIAAWYQKNNRPFVDVAFPEQDVSTGVLQAVVTEFRVGKVEV